MKSAQFCLRRSAALFLIGASLTASAPSHAQTSPASAATTPAAPKSKTQSEVANTKVVFGTVPETDGKVKAAVDSHNLAGAKALIGKPGSLTGTIAGIYAPKSNKIVILNFDRDYKSAVSTVVESGDFAKFPDLKSLEGKRVVISGKFIAFHEGAELMVIQPADVKIIK